MRKMIILGVCLALLLIATGVGVKMAEARGGAQTQGPCDTWGEIKSCFGSNPATCCGEPKSQVGDPQ